MDVRSPDSESKGMPDEAGIWVRLYDGQAAVYEVIFDPSERSRLKARQLNQLGDGPTFDTFHSLQVFPMLGWWRVP